MPKSNKAKNDIITIGGATYDITFFPPKKEEILIDNKKDILRQKLLAFEYGAKIKAEKIVHGFGGGAANTAVSFSRLGFKTGSIVAVGNDVFGQKIIENFKKQKVDAGLVQKKNNFTSGIAFIVIGPDNDRVIFFDDKTKDELRLTAKDVSVLKNTKWIYINSLGKGWEENSKKIFDAKKKNPSVKIAWNPGHNQLAGGIATLGKFLKETDVLILNQDEAIEFVLSDPKIKEKNIDLNEVKNLLPIIRGYGVKIAVITCGKEGAWACDEKEIYYTPIAQEQRRVDTTGVGDAFGSSFVAGLELFNGNINKAMRLGITNTASVVAEPGAQNGLLSKKDLKRLKF